MQSGNRHTFALFVPLLARQCKAATKNDQLQLVVPQHLVHRISKVLRIKKNDHVVLFDEMVHVDVKILDLPSNNKGMTICMQEQVQASQRQATQQVELQLGALKSKEQMEHILYMCAAYGVHSIQLVQCQKSDHVHDEEVEQQNERWTKLFISACEQAKQYVLPSILKPIALDDLLTVPQESNVLRYCGNAYGSVSLLQAMQQAQQASRIQVLIGPEADFSQVELEQIGKHYQMVRLTRSILQSKAAASLFLGALTSI